jgi:hypothetical protein
MADQAEAALGRLGPAPGYEHLDILCLRLRAAIANATGRLERAVELYLQAAKRDRAAGRAASAAYWLGVAASLIAWTDSDTAGQLAAEGLALARQTGYPRAIHQNLLALALALASSDPEQAGQFLHEVLDVRSDSTSSLIIACLVAGRLEDWPALLQGAGRCLQFDRRTGTTPRRFLAGIVNLVARALAPSQAEAAAVLHGAASGLPPYLGPAEKAIVKARDQTTRLLTDSLGEPRLRELQSRGQTMDSTQVCAYALAAMKTSRAEPSTPPPTSSE